MGAEAPAAKRKREKEHVTPRATIRAISFWACKERVLAFKSTLLYETHDNCCRIVQNRPKEKYNNSSQVQNDISYMYLYGVKTMLFISFSLFPWRNRFNMLNGSIPLSSQDSDWKELRDWTSDMLPLVLYGWQALSSTGFLVRHGSRSTTLAGKESTVQFLHLNCWTLILNMYIFLVDIVQWSGSGLFVILPNVCKIYLMNCAPLFYMRQNTGAPWNKCKTTIIFFHLELTWAALYFKGP